MYVCMYLCMYMCVYMFVCKYVLCKYVCMQACMTLQHSAVRLCVYVCVYVCMHAWMMLQHSAVRLHVCMCWCVCVCVCVCMYVCMHACMYVCMYVCMHVCMHAWMMLQQGCMYACVGVCIHGPHIHLDTYGTRKCMMFKHTYDMHVYMCIAACIRTCTQMYVNIQAMAMHTSEKLEGHTFYVRMYVCTCVSMVVFLKKNTILPKDNFCEASESPRSIHAPTRE